MGDALVQSATIQLKDHGGGVFGSRPNVFADGQPFTITGSGFGIKPQAAPIKFSDFKGFAADSLLEANDPDWVHYTGAGATSGALIKQDDTRYPGAKVAYNQYARGGFETNYIEFPNTEEVFFSHWHRTDQVVPGSEGTYWVGKYSRITSPDTDGVLHYNGLGTHELGNANPYYNTPPHKIFTADTPVDLQYMGVPNNEWVRIDMYVKLSDLDVNNGVFDAKTWGHTDAPSTVTNRTATTGAYTLNSIILGLMAANLPVDSPTPDAGMMISDPYIDTTRMRVELCDNADYSLTSTPEIQPAITWTDNLINITVRLGRFSGVSGTYYLHVINAAGNSVDYTEVII